MGNVNMSLVRFGATLLLALSATCKYPSSSCAALGSCPVKAPAPNHSVEGHGNGQPQPRRADPQPKEPTATGTGAVRVTMQCDWYGPFWITFTPAIGGEPKATKERGPSGGTGSYRENHIVPRGTQVSVTCRAMDRPQRPTNRNVQCLLVGSDGVQLPGPRTYRLADAVTGVFCTGVAR